MKNILLIIVLLYGCGNSQKIKDNNSPENILLGQYSFGLTNNDKYKGRLFESYQTMTGEDEIAIAKRNAVLDVCNFPLTFFGDGNGVFLHISDKNNLNFITEKQFNSAKFQYQIRNKNELWTKGVQSKDFTLMFKIIDKSIKNDYFEIGSGSDFNLALYKTGEYIQN